MVFTPLQPEVAAAVIIGKGRILMIGVVKLPVRLPQMVSVIVIVACEGLITNHLITTVVQFDLQSLPHWMDLW